MKLVLIRHGKTEANEKHFYCGSTDIPLSQSGVRELNELKHSCIYPDIDGMRAVTSGMLRCNQTMSIIFENDSFEVISELKEMDFGKFEMHSYEEMKNDEDYKSWISGDNEKNLTPNGESGEIMTARVIRAVEGIISEGADTVAVTHGGVIAAVMAHLFESENKNRYEWQPKPGHGYIIEILNKHEAEYTLI